jgi:hypothetical protein
VVLVTTEIILSSIDVESMINGIICATMLIFGPIPFTLGCYCHFTHNSDDSIWESIMMPVYGMVTVFFIITVIFVTFDVKFKVV